MHGCELAVRVGGKGLVDVLVQSMERGLEATKGEEALRGRPEWRALKALGGNDPRETLYGKLQQSGDSAVRVAALDLLQAIEPDRQLKERLSKMDRADAWMDDLRWWVDSFETLPRVAMEMHWVSYLRRPEQATMVRRALERHQQLRGASDYVAAPRFVHVLSYADSFAVVMGRENLISDLKRRLNLVSHAHRMPEYPRAGDDVDDTLEGEVEKLSRADLLGIDLLLKGLASHATIAELERQGLADLCRTSPVNMAGLVRASGENDEGISFALYPPLFAANNFEYVSSDNLLLETVRGIGQYHFSLSGSA